MKFQSSLLSIEACRSNQWIAEWKLSGTYSCRLCEAIRNSVKDIPMTHTHFDSSTNH